ncbi:MAG: DNA polymerase III subunit [Armatimonadetes bacterium]|nr:DNA polymerase III subunit [Armatimonadota bacterium]
MSDRIGFDKIIGQAPAKRVLMRAVREGQPTHAYLFLGLQGTGKALTAVEFAKTLNCERSFDYAQDDKFGAPIDNSGNACDTCAICHAIDHGNFPDLRIWSPEGQNTKIDQMREMREMARFAPMRGRWKVNIIEQGDTLNDESANCILKLLEEPPDYLINILLFRNAANILPTIRSRCQLVRFTQVNAEELAARLVEEHGLDRKQADFLAAYSQGCPGRAIDLIGNDAFFERRNAVIEVASKASSGNPWLALKLAGVLISKDSAAPEASDEDPDSEPAPAKQAKKGSRDTVIESLDMLVVWYRDLLAAKLQGEQAAVVNLDRVDEILAQASRYPHAGPLAGAVEAILRAKRGILGNANQRIVAEALMMKLAR